MRSSATVITASVLALQVALACGGSEFTAGDGGPPNAGGVGATAGIGGAGRAGATATGGASTGGTGSGGATGGADAGTDGSDIVCNNSLDCPAGQVCDTGAGLCVNCVGDAECPGGERCVFGSCRSECDSDNDCTSQALLCHPELGVCMECVSHADCSDSDYCDGGACRPDLCAQGHATCQGNAVAVCTPAGNGFAEPIACGLRQTCVASDPAASCANWLCTAGATECQDNRVVVCADDGLSIRQSTNCATSGLFCSNGECRPQLCAPSQYFCEGQQVKLCSADGLSASVIQTCAATHYCDAANATCQTLLCTPNQPACNGSVATTCNSSGTGYVPGGTNCSALGQTCASGACTSSVVSDVVAENSTATSATYLNKLKVNFFRADVSRTLTQIEMYLDTTATSLTWLVYESTTQTGIYDGILSAVTGVAGAGARYHSSGPLNVALVAERFYGIGVHWTTGTGYYFASSAQPQTVSFGAMISASTVDATAPPTTLTWISATYAYWQRLSTTP